MSTRRQFMSRVVRTTAAVAASSAWSSRRVLGANDRVRFALIGAGGRGMEDLRAALEAPNVEAVAVADLYTRRLEQAKEVVPQRRRTRTSAACSMTRRSTPC